MKDFWADGSLIYLVGFAAQVLFSARLLVQWFQSERLKKVMTPELFWELSLMASFLLFVYGWLRDDFAIMLGQSLTYFIYIRNMDLQGSWQRLHPAVRGFLMLFPLLVVLYSLNNNQFDVERLFDNKDIPFRLLVWGSLGQVVFTFRFVYQWIYSEYRKRSSLPLGFWLLSLLGSAMILSYAIVRRDPVLFLGQLFGFIVYVRNIMLGKRERTE